MGELGEVGEHHRRIGAGVVLVAQLAECAGEVAAHHRLEQIDDAGAVGEASICRTSSARTGPAAWAIA